MSREDSVAYDLSLFEEKCLEVPRVKSNVVEFSQRDVSKRKIKVERIFAIKVALSAVLVSTILAVVIYSQVQLTEITERLALKAKQLEEQRSIYTQLNMKSESELSLKTIEEYAQNSLNMRRMDPSQAEYISISSADKAQILNKAEKKGILDKIEEFISKFM